MAGNALSDNTWYNQTGAVIKSHPAGSQAFTKTSYDAIGRPVATYTGYYDSIGSDDPLLLINNKIFEQTETGFDEASNVIQTASLARYDDDTTSTGALVAGTSARPAYMAFYVDGLGRSTATAEYGNQGNDSTPFSRSLTTPPRSDTVLVTSTDYNARGEAADQTDPKSQVSSSTYDDAGRMTKVVRNSGSTPTETTETAYTLSSQVKTLTAKNPDPPAGTGDQVTTYTYGVTLPDSKIASNDLLASVEYPGTGTVADRTVNYEYNRQGQQIKLSDQNGSVHDYTYDRLGRQTEDVVSTLAASVDGGVRRVEWTYDNRRRLHKVTSFDAVSGGNETSDVEYLYNDFNQVTTERQQHGDVTSGSSPSVQYAYDDASSNSNTIRRTSVTYPSGEELKYVYSAGADDKLSRVDKLSWDTTEVVDYAYLGLSQVVIQKYTQPANDVEYTLDPNGNNSYAGMDQFGRIVDLRWKQGSTNHVQLLYDYDRASNRKYRLDEVATTPNNKHFDERYGYDGLNRLTSFDRGQLDPNGNNLTNATLGQTWTLDETGNWDEYEQTVTNAFKTTRTHNTVNEITEIDTPTGTPIWDSPPVYDNNGNMTEFVQPANVNAAYTAKYDAWNRLVEVKEGSTLVAEYEYDGLNRRTVKKIYTASGVLDKTRHAYFSNQWQVLEERVDSSSDAERQFVWGLRYIDDLVLRDRDTSNPLNGTLDERLYALQDALFNVVALTNTSGTVQQRFAYQPYGESEVLSGAFVAQTDAYEWEYRFTGRELDLETGLQINRNRYLHLQLGRWLTRDPLLYSSGYANLYVATANNPLSYLDEDGLQPKDGKCCCCCADGLRLTPRGHSPSGHIFNVYGAMSHHESDKNEDCGIEWWEWTDNPPEHYPEKCKNKWCDLRAEGIQPRIFKDWDKREPPCPGSERKKLGWDNPRLITGKGPEGKRFRTRTIYFVIRITSSKSCLEKGVCNRASVTRCAVQYLTIGPFGKISKPTRRGPASFFKFIPCSAGMFTSSPGANPPTLEPPFPGGAPVPDPWFGKPPEPMPPFDFPEKF